MIGLSWWVIVLAVIIIITIIYTVKGFMVAYRCRKTLKKKNEELPMNHDEDSEAGGA